MPGVSRKIRKSISKVQKKSRRFLKKKSYSKNRKKNKKISRKIRKTRNRYKKYGGAVVYFKDDLFIKLYNNNFFIYEAGQIRIKVSNKMSKLQLSDTQHYKILNRIIMYEPFKYIFSGSSYTETEKETIIENLFYEKNNLFFKIMYSGRTVYVEININPQVQEILNSLSTAEYETVAKQAAFTPIQPRTSNHL